MPIPLGPLPPPVQEAIDAWNGFGVVWHGCDGSTWDLMSSTTGIILTPDGTKGLNMPGFDRYSDSSPSQAGSRFRGSRTKDRSIMWPIFVYGDSTQEWLDRDRAWWKSLRPDEPGVWEIIDPNGGSRSLQCYFSDDNDKAFTLDPAQYGWAAYAIDLIADELPYWYGAAISREFVIAAGTEFFLTSGGVVYLSPGDSTDEAQMTNPGDVDAWPTWTVTNAHGGMVLGVGAGSVELPAMTHGEIWTIDTRPNEQTAFDALGVDHSDEVVWNPAPIPRGESIDLTITATTPDPDVTVDVSIVPLYFRAW